MAAKRNLSGLLYVASLPVYVGIIVVLCATPSNDGTHRQFCVDIPIPGDFGVVTMPKPMQQ